MWHFNQKLESQLGCLEQMCLLNSFLFQQIYFKIWQSSCKECKTQTKCIECENLTRYFDLRQFEVSMQNQILRYVSINLQDIYHQNQLILEFQIILINVFVQMVIMILGLRCIKNAIYFSLYCKTCQITSTKFASFNQTQYFRLLNKNQCICQHRYYNNNSLICESNVPIKVLRVKGQEIIAYIVIIIKIELINLFLINILVQLVSIQMKMKIVKKCRSNCIWKDGYFYDGIQVDCQKCCTRCKFCQNFSINCLTCFCNLRDTLPIRNCILGSFEKSFQNCGLNQINIILACEIYVQLVKRPLQIFYHVKRKIHSTLFIMQLLMYNMQRLLIKLSKGDLCYGLCKTCNLDGFLSCNGNRILSPEMSCDQPKNSVSHSNTSWCSTFEVAVVDARFSDDLLSVSVKFDFSLNPSFFTTQFQDNICQKILGNQKYLLIGKNPICYVDPDDDKVRNNFIFYKKLIIKVRLKVKFIQGGIKSYFTWIQWKWGS
ncbi:unnamed protein product [Paramecium pentaurelia]|uniref:Transmembrane protein n=1 Tax=Paramecium pentaurelia TaxID=43138 RepID=A0A8S1VWF5_9CILI|nr:unnamed protein product [Paramecium pentaurelia]